MTDKQIIIKDITECGFYCSKDDTERLYIYEVIKNTDKEWLKETPEQTLLIDEWIYDYTDYDDRKVYTTSGNLVAVCNDSATCKVYKIEDTKYKIYGNCGQFLVEDKPTYKEQLKRKEQECEELKKELHKNFEEKDTLHLIIDRLLEASGYDTKIASAEDFEDVYENMRYEKQQLDQLKAENDEFKEEKQSLIKDWEEKKNLAYEIACKNEQLKQTITEIKEIAESYNHYSAHAPVSGYSDILQKISEVENE